MRAMATLDKKTSILAGSTGGGASGGATHRVVMALRAFTYRDHWGVRELAAELEVAKSGLHRTLQELTDEGLLTCDDSGTYRAGPGLLRLATGLAQSFDLTQLAGPHLQQAGAASGETVILTAYDPLRRQFAAITAAESTQPIQYIWQALRDWSDLHLGASGQAILAFLDEPTRDAIIDGLPDPIPGPRQMSKQQLRRKLTEIRKRGWAASVGERYPGASGVGAPVRNADGEVVGAIVIGWPTRPRSSQGEEHLGEICQTAADGLSRDLGWQGA